MAIDFPASPNINDTHTAAGRTWTWNGTSWVISTNASNYNLPIATAGSLGGIKVGPNLNINATSGVLDVDLSAYSLVGHTHSYSLNSLTDVDTTGAANDKILKYNGTSWVIGDDTAGADGADGADGAPGANGVSIGWDSVYSTNSLSFTADTWTDTGLSITYTPKAADSKIILTSYLNLRGKSTGGSGTTNFSQTFTTNDTISIPDQVSSVTYTIHGAKGGNGGNSSLTQGSAPTFSNMSGGTGSRGQKISGVLTGVNNQSLTLQVGTGGGTGGSGGGSQSGGSGGTGYYNGGQGGSSGGSETWGTDAGGGGGGAGGYTILAGTTNKESAGART